MEMEKGAIEIGFKIGLIVEGFPSCHVQMLPSKDK